MAYVSRCSSAARLLVPQMTRNMNLVRPRHYWPVRYDPFEEMSKNFERVFRDFDRFSNVRSFLKPVLGRAIPVETYDNGKRLFTIEVELPDFKPEDIQVTAKNGNIIIKAKNESNDGNLKQLREFHYEYTLPEKADFEKVRSLFKTDGRLVIEAPLPEQSQLEDKEIPIKKE